MNSKNGVHVNNEKITEEVPLKNDALIRIGETLLLFVTQDFEGEGNALQFYRQRGQSDLRTMDIEN